MEDKSLLDRGLFEALLNDGKSLLEIARLTGLSYTTVRKYAIRWGLWKPRSSGKRTKMRETLEAKKEEIIDAYLNKGFTIKELAEIHSVKPSTIEYVLREWGVLGKKKGWHKCRVEVAKRKVSFPDKKQFDREKTAEELWNLAIERQRKLEKMDVRQKYATIEVSTPSRYIAIVFLSDLHVGSRYCDYARLKEDIELIASNPDVYAFLLGDLYDNFVIPDMKKTYDEIFTPSEQVELCLDVARKLGNSLLVLLAGDHDMFSVYMADYSIVREILSILDCVYLGFGGLVTLRINDRVEYRIAVAHRYRYNSTLNLTHTAKRYLEREYDADVSVIAHGHVADIEEAPMRGRYRIFIRTGTYKLYDRYLALKGYNEVWSVKIPVVIFNTREHEMLPFLDIRKAIKVLDALNRQGEK